MNSGKSKSSHPFSVKQSDYLATEEPSNRQLEKSFDDRRHQVREEILDDALVDNVKIVEEDYMG